MVLREGGLVAFPTETVYGLGADASSEAAVRRLYQVKGRPAGHPVIVHLHDGGALDDWVTDVSEAARALGDACWPGPLTLVLRRSARVPDEVTGGLDTVGVRVPDQPVALELLRVFGGGIAAPSANRFGRVSPTTADDVRADLGDRRRRGARRRCLHGWGGVDDRRLLRSRHHDPARRRGPERADRSRARACGRACATTDQVPPRRERPAPCPRTMHRTRVSRSCTRTRSPIALPPRARVESGSA